MQKRAQSGFRKSGANLTSDLLIFDIWAHICPKKTQIPQKVIVFLIEVETR